MNDAIDAPTASQRKTLWLVRGENAAPETLASWSDGPQARWSVVIEDGPEIDRKRYLACLSDQLDLPFWAFAVAKAYLDDVGEWPLFGMAAEVALESYEEHQDIDLAVREIIAAVHPVWPEVTVTRIEPITAS
ncbi:hypothetical protein [Magnetofaba australis]|nr:hypothetical protein [Magnetofaba australis]